MLLVIANATDARAPVLCEQLVAADARRLVPADLHNPGWCYEPSRPRQATAVVGGEVVAASAIDGVCTLMPCVFATDLPMIADADRAYVAAEMTAFLCAWLTALSAPVINRPTPGCLCGPHWPSARWLHLAAQAGLRALPAGVSTEREQIAALRAAAMTVNVVGQVAFGGSDQAMMLALQLASVTGLAMLRAHFVGEPCTPVLADADLWVDPTQPGVAGAILERLGARR